MLHQENVAPAARLTDLGNPHRSAFTLLEILVVVAIITALAAILTVALSVMSNNSSIRQTKLQLETAVAMQQEYELAYGTPPAWTLTRDASDGSSLAGVGYELQRIPKNRQIFSQLSSTMVKDLAGDWDNGTIYSTSGVVNYLGTRYQSLINNNKNKKPPDFPAAWNQLPDTATFPSLLDGWGRALRFAGGLTNLTVDPNGTHKYYGPTTPRPSGYGSGDKIANQYAAPDNRPFWYSAGPDGDPSTHDDNIYSFQS